MSGRKEHHEPVPEPLSESLSMISRREFLERGAALGATFGALHTGASPIIALGALAGDPLAAAHTRHGDDFTLGNAAITGAWSTANGAFRATRVHDHVAGASRTPAPAAFTLLLADGGLVAADAMRIVSGPRAERLAVRPHASRMADRTGGWQLSLTLRDADARVEAAWRVIDPSPHRS